jgi:tetratricopeptide (TPR) repeat protein
MRFETAVLCLFALAPWAAAAQTSPAAMTVDCAEVNTKVVDGFNSGKLAGAEAALSQFLAGGNGSSDALCTAMALHNLAIVRAAAGRLAEAEALEGRALQILRAGGRDTSNPDLLQPLYVLWSVRFQQGKFGRAREAFNDLRSIPLAQPDERALVGGAAAEQSFVEGRYGDSEREFQSALRECDNAGIGATPYTASLLTSLGVLHLAQGRVQDAERALQRAVEIFSSSSETLPTNLMKLFVVRGFLRVREERWREAEEDLSAAIAIAEREAPSDGNLVKPMLARHAFVLRKLHRNKQARSVEDRVRSIGTSVQAGDVVDITQLTGEFQRGKK